ncbi:MBL fold metallo-hydrolase [Alphaproteobacteria bacterium HT1-32]|nr:MBL fold metallo-hydrolase [Alphaproteobacteria bacterium HT1-32]
MRKLVLALGATAALMTISATAMAQSVKVTPLGSHDGEFCIFDRAMLFEDPDGTRILYDAGRTVAGAEDPRLGKVDAVLVSHMHGDHVGDRHIAGVNSGECGKPDLSVVDAPNTNVVNIALATNAAIVTGSEMPAFFGNKLKMLGGDPKKSQLVRFGASRKVGGVTVTTVPANHSNGVHPAFVDGELGEMLKGAGLNAYVGPPTGYVLTFSNGLVTYLSGDTGVVSEQKTVVADQYGAKLVVMNIGDVFTTGPKEAAYVINDLIKPVSVIPSHANEVATKGGKVVAGSKTETFMQAVTAKTYLPISGQTLSFDGAGACTDGC